MSAVCPDLVFKGVINFQFEVFQGILNDGEDPFAGIVEMMPQASLPAVRAFIVDLFHQDLDWREMDRRWRDAGSDMMVNCEKDMHVFLKEVLTQIDRKIATAR